MIAYCVVKMTTKDWDNRYDIDVKVQGQIFLKYVLTSNEKFSYFFDRWCYNSLTFYLIENSVLYPILDISKINV